MEVAILYEENKKRTLDIETEIEELRQKANPLAGASAVLIILFAIGLITAAIIAFNDGPDSLIVTIIIFALTCIFSGFALGNRAEKYKKKMTLLLEKIDTISEVLGEYFTDFKHEKYKHISKEIVKEAKLETNYTDVYGNDYICANYKGTSFEFSDIRLDHSSSIGDSIHTKTIISGLWMIVSLDHRVIGNLSLWEQPKYVDKDKIFDKRFVIKPSNALHTSLILSPEFQTEIIELSDRIREKYFWGQFLFGFRDDKLHIVLHCRHDNFEVNIHQKESIKEIKERFHSEAKCIVDILETLKQNKSLFK